MAGRYEEASTSMQERLAKLRQTAGSRGVQSYFLGAIGIEDMLQDGVPEAIESLGRAGIKGHVWMLVLVLVVVFNTSKLTHKKLTPLMLRWRC
jgi:cation transport ATPase